MESDGSLIIGGRRKKKFVARSATLARSAGHYRSVDEAAGYASPKVDDRKVSLAWRILAGKWRCLGDDNSHIDSKGESIAGPLLPYTGHHLRLAFVIDAGPSCCIHAA